MMAQGVLYKTVLLVFLSSLQPGRLREEQPIPDNGNNAGVAEVFDAINALLNTIQSNTSTLLREFHSFRDEVKGDLMSLREDLSNLSMCLQEHKQQTAAELAQLQTSLNTTQSSVESKLDHLSSLREDLSSLNDSVSNLSMCLQEHKQQTTADAQQLNYRLDTLTTIQQCDSQQNSSTQTTTATIGTTTTTPTTPTLNATTPTTPTLTATTPTLNATTPTTPTINATTPTTTTTSTNVTTTIPTFTCGGTGGWRRVVSLDMTDPNTTCPSGWNMTGYSKRTCGRASDGRNICDLVTFPVSGGEYSRVCGRIKAYQWGVHHAFRNYLIRVGTNIDGVYVDGISITHSNLQQHIWTFAVGWAEDSTSSSQVCPCDTNHIIRIPPFVGEDYFCESGMNRQLMSGVLILYSNDPLWDGENCLSSSTCCSLHNPPYFVKQLPTPTTDDIEARICQSSTSIFQDIAVELIDLYIQ